MQVYGKTTLVQPLITVVACVLVLWNSPIYALDSSFLGEEDIPLGNPLATETTPKVPAGSQTPLLPDGQKIHLQLVAKHEAMLASRFFGTIQNIYVKESDRFKKGAPLVQFDCRELAAERRAASAELRSSQETSKANNELRKQQVVGELETKLARLKVDEASARVNVVNAKMGNCRIYAPFAGQVVEIKAKSYESLQPGSPIMLIQDSKNLEMHVHVPSTWLLWVKPGTTFESFVEETGKSYPAEVISIGARIDAVSRTVKIYARITGDFPELLPGMSGYAQFDKP